MRETISIKFILVSLLCLLCAGSANAQTTGGKLIYCRNQTLYAVPITPSGELQTGKRPHKIARLPNGTTLDSLSVSADGSLVVFGTRPKDELTCSLWAVEAKADAQPHRIGNGTEPAFAAWGKRLAFSDSENIYLLDFTTGKKRLFRANAHSPNWSADENEIALIDESKHEHDNIVMVMDTATGKQVRFQKEAVCAHSSLLSPDGRFIAYNQHLSRPKLPGIIEDRKTGHSIVLPHAGEPVLDWSTDSHYLLWTRYIISPQNEGASLWEEIWTTTADGKQSHKIGAGANACFAPDGKHVIYLRTQADSDAERLGLYTADLHDHSRRILSDCDDVFAVWKPTQHLNAANASQRTQKTGYVAWKK